MVLWLAYGVQMGAGGAGATPTPVPALPMTGAGQ